MRVNREDLLGQLESVQPGLSPKELVEQSSCFAFKNGKVFTFNDEVACQRQTSLKKFTGAVAAAPLLALLQKLPNDELELEPSNGKLLVNAKRRQAGVRMEQDVLLPIDAVEAPNEWSKLHDDFAEAVDMAQQCAGHDETEFKITCVHIHPKWVEASDNFQITRYRLKTGFTEGILVRHSSIKHIVTLGMTEFSLTDAWVHFKNPSGLILSCRRYLDSFPDLGKYLLVEGTKTTLPKGLMDAVDKADIFAAENKDNHYVQVELRPGKLRIRGEGSLGWYSEVTRIKYNGEALQFHISPKLLVQLAERHNEVLVSENRLKVDGGKYVYLTVVGKVKGNGNDKSKKGKREKGEEADNEDGEDSE